MSASKTCFVLPLLLCSVGFLPRQAAADDLQDLVAYETRAGALADAGKFREAAEVSRKMIAFAEQRFQHDPKFIGLAWNNLANQLLRLDDFKQAERAASKALQIELPAVGANAAIIADALTNLGNAHRGLHRYAEALAEHQQALRIREISIGPESKEAADTLENLGVLQADLSRHAEAEPYYRRALAIKTQLTGGRDLSVAQLHFNLGHGYLEQRRLAQAESHLQHALKLYEAQGGPEYWVIARVASALGRLYCLKGSYAEAEQMALRSAALCLKQYGPDDPTVAANQGLADVYLAQGRFAAAEELYQRALRFYEMHPQHDQGDSAKVLDGLARVYARQKLWEKSLIYSDRTFEKLSGHETAAELNHYYLRRGITRAELGRADAMDDFRRAIELSEHLRAHFTGADESRGESFALFSHAYFEAAKFLLKQQKISEAFTELERARARSLIDQMNAAQVDLLAGIPVAQARALHQAQASAEIRLASLEQQWRDLGSQTSLGKAELETARKELASSLASARHAVAEAHTAVRTASPAYRQAVGKNFAPVEFAALEAWAKQHQSLVLYYVDLPDDCYVLSIGRKGGSVYTALAATESHAAELGIEAGALDHSQLKTAFTAPDAGLLLKLADPKRAKDTTAALAALWEVLVPAADRAELVAGTYKSLTVVTCSSLYSFPFETLVTSAADEPTYLLDSGPPILYAPSASVLLNLAESSRSAVVTGRAPLLTVGDPTYPANSKTPRLPFTATESHWVKEAYGKRGQAATQFLTASSNEAAVRSQIAGRRVVHLACHGSADQAYGNLFGSLLLTPGQRGTAADDGQLTLGEIYSLDLRGCELTILSACQTNYGPQQLGEGGWALTRGFLAAGSRRVVSSNWVVDDKAAATLIYFFTLESAKSKDTVTFDHALALQQAKRAIRKRDEWRSPFYWGSFVLVGPQ